MCILATVIIKSALIILDEASIGHRHLLEGLDLLLQDLMKDQRPFGGKTIILAGDFRQILSIVIRGTRKPHHKCFFQAVKTVETLPNLPLKRKHACGS